MTVENIRKNSKPAWYQFKGIYCLNCGNTFSESETILSGMYCIECSPKKELEVKIDKDHEFYWVGFHSVCVKCAKPFQSGDQTLFGLYCISCGHKWEKERKLRQARLKKARGI